MNEQYTIRIYDSKIVKKLEKVYSDVKDLYSTKNPFVVECINRGLDSIVKDLNASKKVESISELYDEMHLTVEKLDNLIKLSERNAKENIANLTVNQKLLSCNYNMLLGLSDNAPKKADLVEAGMYDDLPERLLDMLEDILKVYLKK